MKRTILLLVIIFLCMSCDPDQNSMRWSVKNCTEQTLQLKYPYQSIYSLSYRTVPLAPGDSVILFGGTEGTRYKVYFNHYFEWTAGYHGKDIYWQILSDSGEELRTWNYSDMGKPGERFFDASSWHFSQQQPDGRSAFIVMEYSWVFDILPEDIN